MNILILIIKKIINNSISFLFRFKITRYIINKVLFTFINQKTLVSHNNIELELTTPSTITKWRANTFSTKEPETLEWIEGMEEGSCFWDVGANIGLYSIYGSKLKNLKVFSFEPSVFNLELLCRNINNNNLTNQINVVPIAMSNKNGFNAIYHSNEEWGGALSVFGEDFGTNGKKLSVTFKYLTLGFKADEFLKIKGFIQPDYIKIDVDGIEHLILNEAQETLSKTKSVLVEINEDFKEQREQSEIALKKAGLKLKKKRRTSPLESDTANVFNQIWIR